MYKEELAIHMLMKEWNGQHNVQYTLVETISER